MSPSGEVWGLRSCPTEPQRSQPPQCMGLLHCSATGNQFKSLRYLNNNPPSHPKSQAHLALRSIQHNFWLRTSGKYAITIRSAETCKAHKGLLSLSPTPGSPLLFHSQEVKCDLRVPVSSHHWRHLSSQPLVYWQWWSVERGSGEAQWKQRLGSIIHTAKASPE